MRVIIFLLSVLGFATLTFCVAIGITSLINNVTFLEQLTIWLNYLF